MTGRGRPNPRRSNGSARNRVIAAVRREESECWLCGKPVDRTLPPWLPASPEVDEIVPVAFGGDPFDRANCRLAHRACNRARADRLRRARSVVEPVSTGRTW